MNYEGLNSPLTRGEGVEFALLWRHRWRRPGGPTESSPRRKPWVQRSH